MKIRFLNASDAKLYRDFRLKGLKESPLAFSESYEDECEKNLPDIADFLAPVGNPPEKFTLGVMSNHDGLLATVTFERDTRIKARHKAMLSAMYVLPEARGRGVGRRLLDAVVEKASHLDGLEQIHLWVLRSLESASGFYQQSGFLSQGPVVKGDLKVGEEYVDAEYMVRRL